MSKESLRKAASSVALRVRHLQNGPEAIRTAKKFPWLVEGTIKSYDALIEMLPNLTTEQLSIMPNTVIFLEKIGDERMPTLTEMVEDPKWNANCGQAQENLYQMMWKADQNEYHGGSFEKDETIYFGAKVKDSIPYVIGIVGHMVERMVVNTLESPSEPWQKDDLMHTFNELAMLKALKDPRNGNLLTWFALPRDRQGLEWISPDYWLNFRLAYSNLSR